MKETQLPTVADAESPAGADVRFIMDGITGSMIHSTVPPRQINRATIHATVSEFWYVLEGDGQIWRKDGTAICRIHYWRKPGAIPAEIEGQAAYWKRHYNTPLGRGTVEKYLKCAIPLTEGLDQ